MKNADVFALPGTLTLGGVDYLIPKQSASDVARTHDEMRRLAQKECVSPLAYVNSLRDVLDGITFAEAVRTAVMAGAGGGAEPSREAVLRQYDTLEGVRFRAWYQASRGDKALQDKAARDKFYALITDENYYDVADALAKALGLGADEKKAPGSGPSS